LASATLQFPYLDITTAQSAGKSPFFGGVIAYGTSQEKREQLPLSLSVRKPRLNNATGPPLLSLDDALIMGFVLDKQFLIGLHGVV
jgi:hypothetical protein